MYNTKIYFERCFCFAVVLSAISQIFVLQSMGKMLFGPLWVFLCCSSWRNHWKKLTVPSYWLYVIQFFGIRPLTCLIYTHIYILALNL